MEEGDGKVVPRIDFDQDRAWFEEDDISDCCTMWCDHNIDIVHALNLFEDSLDRS